MVASAFVCRALTIGHFETVDEVHWMRRSGTFSDAITNFDPASASVTGSPNLFGGTLATMPGVPTMWLGSISRMVWGAGRSLGLWSDDSPFRSSPSGLTVAQLSVALATSLLIGLVVWLMHRWAAPRAALVTGVLLATEPFWVAHGSVIHTDELTVLFGVAGLLALALVLGVPNVDRACLHRTVLALGAGVLLACSPLTKVSGIGYAPGAVALVVWAAILALRGRGEDVSVVEVLRPVVRVIGLAAGAAVATVLVLWPAIWADFGTQVTAVRDAIQIGYTEQDRFFRGEIRPSPSPLFYLVAVPFRMTPWMLAAVLIGVPVALARRATRARSILMLLIAAPVAYTLSSAVQQVDRYGLLVLGPLCVVIGLAFIPASDETRLTASRVRFAILGVGLLATVHAAVVAPWGLAYFNPVLGGGKEAVRQVPVGWHEGQEIVGQRIVALEEGECDDVTVNGMNFFLARIGQCSSYAEAEQATYVVLYITDVQLMTPADRAKLTEGRKLVSTLTIRDIEYATVWR